MFYTFYDDTFNIVCICEIEIVDVIWHTLAVNHFHGRSVWKAMVFDIVRWKIWINTVWMRNIWNFYYREN